MNENAGTGPGLRKRRMISAIVAAGLALPAVTATVAGAATPTVTVEEASDVEQAGDVEQEIPAEVGRSIGSPDAGPDPQHSGDRGGWAQLVTLGALSAGVGFIMWRVIGAARQAPGSSDLGP